MKTLIGSLLLTFVILLSSIQLSAQSGNHQLPDVETFENVPSGRNIRLSNGHFYRSVGNDPITVRYNIVNRDAYIRQGGRVGISTIHNDELPNEEFFENIQPGSRIHLANGSFYTSLGTETITVLYNTVNRVAHVHQGNNVTVL